MSRVYLFWVKTIKSLSMFMIEKNRNELGGVFCIKQFEIQELTSEVENKKLWRLADVYSLRFLAARLRRL